MVAGLLRTPTAAVGTPLTGAAPASSPVPTPDVQVAAGSIQGAVANGTSGAPSPADLVVSLHGYDNFATSLTLTTTTDGAGAFQFQNVPNIAGRYYMLSVPYQGVPYSSDLLKFDANATTLHPRVQLYEATADASVLRLTQVHLIFDLAGDGATVTEICLFSNTGDRTFITSNGAGFTLPVPKGAAAVVVQTQQGSIFADRTVQGLQIKAPLLPGPSTAELAFTFRLLNQPVTFEQSMPFPVDSLAVLGPDGGPAIQGAGLQDSGTQTFQGKSYRAFSASNLAAGQTIAFQFSGGALGPRWLANSSLLPVVGLVLLNLALVAVIGTMLWRQRRAPGRAATK